MLEIGAVAILISGIIGAGLIATAFTSVWKLINMIRENGQSQQKLIDAVATLQKESKERSEFFNMLNKKIDDLTEKINRLFSCLAY